MCNDFLRPFPRAYVAGAICARPRNLRGRLNNHPPSYGCHTSDAMHEGDSSDARWFRSQAARGGRLPVCVHWTDRVHDHSVWTRIYERQIFNQGEKVSSQRKMFPNISSRTNALSGSARSFFPPDSAAALSALVTSTTVIIQPTQTTARIDVMLTPLRRIRVRQLSSVSQGTRSRFASLVVQTAGRARRRKPKGKTGPCKLCGK